MRIVGFGLKLVAGLAIASLAALFFGWFVQHLWNWLMPAIFHLPTVTFWQAAGLVLLSRIFVGHGGGHRGHHKGWRKWRSRHACGSCGDKGDKSSAFAPGGDVHNWEHFDDWWKQGGESSFEASVAHGNRGWGWWKWWKTEGRAAFERWMETRKP
jgi:hypothetical protein